MRYEKWQKSRCLLFEPLEQRALLAAVAEVNIPDAPVESVDVVFTEPVVIEQATIGSALTLLNLKDGELDISGGTISYDEASRTLTWSLGEVLPRGVYQLQVDGSKIADTDGSPLRGGTGGLEFSIPVFAAAEEVQANSEPIIAGDFSVPSLADWDSDGRLDLVVGEKTPAGEGKVRIYLNAGTAAAPLYTDYLYAQQSGSDLVVGAAGCLGMFPRVSDWDGDGKKDLVVGLAGGQIQLFPNVGTDADPQFGAPSDLTVGEPGSKQAITVGARATLEVVDWNNDGRNDLVAGGFDGGVRVYINEAVSGAPDFRIESTVFDGENPLAVPDLRASVAVADLDGDGRKDLVLGDTEGHIRFFQNVGADAAPLFDGSVLIEADGLAIDLAGTPRSRPFVGDINADRIPDLLVGAQDGRVRGYDGLTWTAGVDGSGTVGSVGGEYVYTFDASARVWTNPVNGLDVDGDGSVGRSDGQLIFDELNLNAYTDATGQLLDMPSSGLAPPHIDVDGDGYCIPRDVLLIVYYLNNESAEPEGEASGWGSQILALPAVPSGETGVTDPFDSMSSTVQVAQDSVNVSQQSEMAFAVQGPNVVSSVDTAAAASTPIALSGADLELLLDDIVEGIGEQDALASW